MAAAACARPWSATASLNGPASINPWQPGKRGGGMRDVPVTFADVRFAPGEWLYADQDGVVVSDTPLNLQPVVI